MPPSPKALLEPLSTRELLEDCQAVRQRLHQALASSAAAVATSQRLRQELTLERARHQAQAAGQTEEIHRAPAADALSF